MVEIPQDFHPSCPIKSQQAEDVRLTLMSVLLSGRTRGALSLSTSHKPSMKDESDSATRVPQQFAKAQVQRTKDGRNRCRSPSFCRAATHVSGHGKRSPGELGPCHQRTAEAYIPNMHASFV